ncbi:pre-rRNA-processing protein TSR1 [Pelomyxa schiedti]|nr:pre-rRNA-processing protein TSR1 [Pelomyxa schiedti]
MQRHDPGTLKQHNKPFKAKHATKGELKKRAKGKLAGTAPKPTAAVDLNKVERRNQGKQKIAARRAAAVAEARATGSLFAPKTVAVISLEESVEAWIVVKAVLRVSGVAYSEYTVPVTCKVQNKHRATFVVPPTRDIDAILDAAKVADIIMFAISAEGFIDETHDMKLNLLFSQGLPTVMFVMQGLRSLPEPKQSLAKKARKEELSRRFPTISKMFCVDTREDTEKLARQLLVQSVHIPAWRKRAASYLLADKIIQDQGSVALCGYLKQGRLSPNQLVHVTGVGTFQLSKISVVEDPCAVSHAPPNLVDVAANPELQESLLAANIPDPMAAEQTWPTPEELAEAEASQMKQVQVPKGTSAYQASWLLDKSEREDDEEGDGLSSGSEDAESDEDMKKQIKGLQSATKAIEDEEPPPAAEHALSIMADDSASVTTVNDANYDDTGDADGLEQKWRESRDDLEFPDEVDLPYGIPAKVRFRKYRGLQSFRTSPWNPKENLPLDYARIFQFKDFKGIKKRILAKPSEGVQPGNYVAVYLKDFPQEMISNLTVTRPLVLSGLRKYENKCSVNHFLVRRFPCFEEPLKSKERLEFHVGFRRFFAFPIYSDHSPRANKHKFSTFFHPDSVLCASIYGPVTFPPCPVLMFKYYGEQKAPVSNGYLMSVDPDRIICKRIILTGFPFKIFKRKAVVRGMFYTPQDIKYWKKIELWTKHKCRGHILEPLGTHGHMKCIFDHPLKADDTVCMSLYKRVYPVWSEEDIKDATGAGPSPETGTTTTTTSSSSTTTTTSTSTTPTPVNTPSSSATTSSSSPATETPSPNKSS